MWDSIVCRAHCLRSCLRCCLESAESAGVPSALVDSVLFGPEQNRGHEVVLHRCHVVSRSEGWGAARGETTTPL